MGQRYTYPPAVNQAQSRAKADTGASRALPQLVAQASSPAGAWGVSPRVPGLALRRRLHPPARTPALRADAPGGHWA